MAVCTIEVERAGDNLFVIRGCQYGHGTMQITSARDKDDLSIDPERRAYLQVSLKGRWGMVARILRRSDDAVLHEVEARGGSCTLSYDPGDCVRIDVYTLDVQEEELILSAPYSAGLSHLLSWQGVTLEGGVLQKRFPRSRFLYGETSIEAAIREFRLQCDYRIGTSGYSNMDEKRCRELDLRLGQYEHAVVGLVNHSIAEVRHTLPAARPGIVHGSSGMGVDLALMRVANENNIPNIGTTCLEYLWYVDNASQGPKVLIARSKEDYNRLYVSQLDILLAANGAETSFKMDVHAATEALIPVIPIDIIGMLGSKVPAFKTDPATGERRVNDAVGVLLKTWLLIDWNNVPASYADDRFPLVARKFSNCVVARVRELIAPKHGYSIVR